MTFVRAIWPGIPARRRHPRVARRQEPRADRPKRESFGIHWSPDGYLRLVKDREAWEEEAENWVRFARTPGHDAYWYYRDSFFDKVMPAPGRLTLELGCGEGRVTRDLLSRGHRVVSVDGSMTLLRHAVESDPMRRYVRADAGRLPLRSGSVGVVVAYNALMDFDDLSAAVAEVRRVLVGGGMFCICITHPMQYTGGFDGEDLDAPYVLSAAYFGTRRFDETFVRDEISMRFRGWDRPMEDYLAPLFDAGFVLDAFSEPRPNTAEGRYARWHRFPMFLFLRAIKRSAGPLG
jgi:SAM-dependent methyltransferase